MIFKWETDEERTRRYMKISPEKKLEWLQEMKEFMAKCSPPHPASPRKRQGGKKA